MGLCPHCGGEVDPNDLQARDNSFRDEPAHQQLGLDDIASEESEGSVWDYVDIDESDIRGLDVTGPELQPGETLNEHDPSQW